ncbi:hypothetical protein [Glaciihabitans sp. dw_435]|uniref:hypothetical protein n=1 Tax=Glaciihabitans sp. dw_435 TaxID=2720081 RepID=UPI001BD5A430|nr:hypothetical protein [Glaciihabitans sp. dw_435]
MTTMMKPHRSTAEKYLLGGENARDILATLRSFPLSVSGAREILVHNTATGAAAAALQRAYEHVEMQLLADEDKCERRASHSTMDEYEYRDWVLRNVGLRARRCLGELDLIDAIWIRRSTARSREVFAPITAGAYGTSCCC